MPGTDGIELAQAISLAPSLRNNRLVMLTSTTDRRVAAREAGIGAYVQKPPRRARLLATVAGAMGVAPEREAAVPVPAPVAGPAGDAILVFEDNAVNQAVIRGMLAKRGYRLEC